MKTKVNVENFRNCYRTFYGKRLSKRCVRLGYDADGYWSVIGSPADIRKIIRLAEREDGTIPTYDEPLVMREGRLYMLVIDPDNRFWTVYRAT